MTTIDHSDAGIALSVVAASRQRASELRTYADGGEVLIGWGVAWLLCNLVGQFAPLRADWAWAVGITFAVVWTMVRSRNRADLRILGTVGAGLGFVGLSVMITAADARAQDALISLFVAMSYVVLGLWTGLRFAFLGMVISASIMFGWLVFPDWLYLWLALGGGGPLIIGGLWLRRA